MEEQDNYEGQLPQEIVAKRHRRTIDRSLRQSSHLKVINIENEDDYLNGESHAKLADSELVRGRHLSLAEKMENRFPFLTL
jgi:hypothetical protein